MDSVSWKAIAIAAAVLLAAGLRGGAALAGPHGASSAPAGHSAGVPGGIHPVPVQPPATGIVPLPPRVGGPVLPPGHQPGGLAAYPISGGVAPGSRSSIAPAPRLAGSHPASALLPPVAPPLYDPVPSADMVRLQRRLAMYQPLIIESCTVVGLGRVLINSNQEVVQANGPIGQVIGERRRSGSMGRCIYDLSVAGGTYCVGADGALRDSTALQTPVPGGTVSAPRLPGTMAPGATISGAILPGGIVPGVVAGSPAAPFGLRPIGAGLPAVQPLAAPANPMAPIPALRTLGQCTPVLIVR